MRKLWLIGALLATSGSFACRKAVIVSFPGHPPIEVSRIFVEAPDNHKQVTDLVSLDETAGFWDISGATLHVITYACDLPDTPAVLTGDNYYDIRDDEVHVQDLALPKDDPNYKAGNDPCIDHVDAGMDSGTDVADAQTDTGFDSGMDASPDNSCANPADTPDAGGQLPPPPTIGPGCQSYCNSLLISADGGPACGVGPNTYDSVDECLRYCTIVQWQNPEDPRDRLDCRVGYITNGLCDLAGPHGDCGDPCLSFCYAWSQLCDPTGYDGCKAACAAAGLSGAGNSHEPGCRFKLLPRAVYDKHYCTYLGYGSCTFACTDG
jgi:hypothetical protein